jgi:hypothetical protein
MKGVARSFWAVVAVVVAVEVFIGFLAVRSVQTDLRCWLSGLKNRGFSGVTCGAPTAIVGPQNWYPAAAILFLFAVTIITGLTTFVSQYMRTKGALRRLGPQTPSPEYLVRIESLLGIEVRLCNDGRCFCCCAGLFSPTVIISRGMMELLDEGQLTAVLAHEAAHVRRHDPARALAVRCAANALFYLPLVRHLSKKALVASELGADSVAASVAGQTALVRALLVVLGKVRPALGTVTEMASLDALDSRIEALRTKALPRVRPTVLIMFASALVLAGLILLAVWLPHPVELILRQVRHIAHAPSH